MPAGLGAIGTPWLRRTHKQLDLAVYKDLGITERMKFRFGAQFGNIFNHPQYLPGSNPGVGLGVNDARTISRVAVSNQRNTHKKARKSLLMFFVVPCSVKPLFQDIRSPTRPQLSSSCSSLLAFCFFFNVLRLLFEIKFGAIATTRSKTIHAQTEQVMQSRD
jgi:hypothetical protein